MAFICEHATCSVIATALVLRSSVTRIVAALQDNFKKYGDGAGFVEPDVAKTIVSAGPKVQMKTENGHAII